VVAEFDSHLHLYGFHAEGSAGFQLTRVILLTHRANFAPGSENDTVQELLICFWETVRGKTILLCALVGVAILVSELGRVLMSRWREAPKLMSAMLLTDAVAAQQRNDAMGQHRTLSCEFRYLSFTCSACRYTVVRHCHLF
jgi:hypothetical protein